MFVNIECVEILARAGKCKIHKNSKTVIKNTKNGHDDITNASKIVRRGQKPPQNISTHLIPTQAGNVERAGA